ncbi:MAG: peptidase inhibitor family I36 protein [Acidobacteria bacterium]|nr:peptidase inhibitor family I36 protein [Acidobacteriota bacterium]
MQRTIRLTFLTLMVLTILSPALQAQGRSWNQGNQPRDGACFYVDRDYQGEEYCVDADESQHQIANRYNDRISSVRIFGKAQVVVYEHENLGGARRVLASSTPGLGDFNDKISSIEVTGDRSRGGKALDSVCFYADRDYHGEEFCVYGNESRPTISGRFNDRISSIRIFGSAQVVVYEHENFSGTRRALASDTPGLGDFNDKISSIEITVDRMRGNEPREGACFYEDRDYQGEEFCMNSNENQKELGDRQNDKISSVRIFSRAQVVAYEHENFGGARRVVVSNTPGLGDFNDKISSIEVR